MQARRGKKRRFAKITILAPLAYGTGLLAIWIGNPNL